MEFQVKAAGGVVHRDNGRGDTEFAVIHRPRYDDWSLPKGKLERGESFEQAALREIGEEIGVRGALGEELPSATYTDHKGRRKLVRYWLVRAEDAPAFTPNDEVDDMRWMSAADALPVLTYARDRELVEAACDALGCA